MRILFCILFFQTYLFAISGRDRRPAQSIYTRDLFYRQLKSELEKSFFPLLKQRAQQKIIADKELAASKDPWSISQSLKDTSKSTSEPRYSELLATTNLKFENPKGFVFQSYVDFFDATQLNASSSRFARNDFGFSFSQDLMTLKKKTQYQFNIELVDIQSRATLASKDKGYLAQVLNMVDMSFTLFSSLCKKSDLEKALTTVQGTLAVAQVQRHARTISTTEMLRVRSTYYNVKRQVDAINKQIVLTQDRFYQISNSAFQRAVEMSKGPLQCDESVEDLKNIELPTDEEVDSIVNRHPAFQELWINRDAIKKQLEAYRNTRNLKLNASLGYDQINNEARITPAYNQVYVALTLTYEFKGKEFESRNKVYFEQLHGLSVDQKIQEQALIQQLDDLIKTVRQSQNQIPMVQDSITNATQLLKIIETQQSIGQLDASAIDSAFQSQISALADMRDLGDSIYRAATKLSELKEATAASPAEK